MEKPPRCFAGRYGCGRTAAEDLKRMTGPWIREAFSLYGLGNGKAVLFRRTETHA